MPPAAAGAIVAIGSAIVGVTGVAVLGVTLASGVLASALVLGAGAALLTKGILKAFDVPDVANQAQANQELRVGGVSDPRMVVGETVLSGNIVKYHKGTRAEKDYHHMYINLTTRPCTQVSAYQLDGKSITNLTGNGYFMEARLGDQTGPTARSLLNMPNVDASFIGTGCADVYGEFEINPDIFPNGVQDLKFLVKGSKFYDPRKDSTVGGSGSHRLNDPSTWEWTSNPALINFYWKLFGWSLPLDPGSFDMANIIEEANICDELVDYLDTQGQTLKQKRYTCNGVINLTNNPESVEEALLSSCAGRWVESAGQYRLLVGAYRGPALITITEKDLAGDIERNPHTPLSDRCNMVHGSHISKHHYYQPTDMPTLKSDFLLANRDAGVELPHNLQLLYTDTDTEAQRLANIHMNQNAAGDTIKLPLFNIALAMIPGTTVTLNLPKYNINGEYEVQRTVPNLVSGVHEVVVKETSADIWSQSNIPAQRDLTPNQVIDNTTIAAPTGITYTETPNDYWRAGYLSWSHPSPTSVERYRLRIFTDQGAQVGPERSATSGHYDVIDLLAGSYRVEIAARNRWDKHSEPAELLFDVVVQAQALDVQILTGFVFIQLTLRGRPATHTLSVQYAYDEAFTNPIDGGSGQTLHIEPDVKVDVWLRYKIVTPEGEGAWLPSGPYNLVGYQEGQLSDDLLNSLPTATQNPDGSITITVGSQSVTVQDGPGAPIPTYTQNPDGSVTIDDGQGNLLTIPAGADGEHAPIPQLGVDYFDGRSGDYVSTIFRIAASLPATPTGGTFNGTTESFPTGWTDRPQYAGGEMPEWASTTRYREQITYPGGVRTSTWTKVGGWSVPAIHAQRGQDGTPGATGPGWFATIADASANGRTPVAGDIAIQNDQPVRYNGSAWVPYASFIPGSLLVDGAVDSRTLNTGEVFAKAITVSGSIRTQNGSNLAQMGGVGSLLRAEGSQGEIFSVRTDGTGRVNGQWLTPGSVGYEVFTQDAIDFLQTQLGSPGPATGGTRTRRLTTYSAATYNVDALTHGTNPVDISINISAYDTVSSNLAAPRLRVELLRNGAVIRDFGFINGVTEDFSDPDGTPIFARALTETLRHTDTTAPSNTSLTYAVRLSNLSSNFPDNRSLTVNVIEEGAGIGSGGSGFSGAWVDITGKPDAAIRWPTWDEVSSKPTISVNGLANSLMQRNASGDVECRLFASTFASTNADIAGIYTTRTIGGDYMRPSTPAQVKAALGLTWADIGGTAPFAGSSHSHTASEVSGLATVATSGSYNDLSNRPTIPSVPANVFHPLHLPTWGEVASKPALFEVGAGTHPQLAPNGSTAGYARAPSSGFLPASASSGQLGTSTFRWSQIHGDSITAANTVQGGEVQATSDIRVKTDIKRISDALGKLSSLRGATYWRTDLDRRSAGPIAQEVQAVLPEAVGEFEGKLNVSPTALIALLIEAVNALAAKVADLEANQ